MSFIQIQGIIFFSIILFSIMCGKKGTLIASIIWIVETIIIYKTSRSNYLQVICVSLSFQIICQTAHCQAGLMCLYHTTKEDSSRRSE